MRILFTCAGRRGYLFDFFREAAPGIEILASDSEAHASALLQADRAFVVPKSDAPSYRDAVLGLCRRERVDLLFSLHDYDLPHIAAMRGALRAAGTTPVVSSPEAIATCLDKYATFGFLTRHGLGCPKTWPAADALPLARRGDLPLPLFVKPREGSGSAGVHRVDRLDELETYVRNPAAYLVQELLTGEEYGVDVLNDVEGNVLAVTVKRKLQMRSGETDKSVTVKHPEILELAAKVGQALGHVGNLDMDVFVTASGPKVLELNPRFGGGYPGSHVAGAAYPRKLLESLVRRPPQRPLDDYEEGVYCFKGISLHVARAGTLDAFPRLEGDRP